MDFNKISRYREQTWDQYKDARAESPEAVANLSYALYLNAYRDIRCILAEQCIDPLLYVWTAYPVLCGDGCTAQLTVTAELDKSKDKPKERIIEYLGFKLS